MIENKACKQENITFMRRRAREELFKLNEKKKKSPQLQGKIHFQSQSLCYGIY